MYSVQEIKAIQARVLIGMMEPKLKGALDYLEHYNPDLHKIHDPETCYICKANHQTLYYNPNAFSKEKPKKKVLALLYNTEKNKLVEKETGCSYNVKLGSKRHKMISVLISNKIFIDTTLLASISGSTSLKSTRSTIQKINTRFMKEFETDQKLIVGKTDEGYRVNPAIRFVSERNNP